MHTIISIDNITYVQQQHATYTTFKTYMHADIHILRAYIHNIRFIHNILT